MYEIKFSEYNQLTKEIMCEESTLENIVDLSLDGKPSREQKKHLSNGEDWAKYAFENEYEYYITFYQNNSPFACVCHTDMHITIYYLDFYNDELINYLTLVYHRYDLLKYMNEDKTEYFDNHNLFLGEIISYSFDENKTNTKIVFSIKGFAIVTIAKTSADKDIQTAKQKVNVNIHNNFIRPPENYKDFEYLLDYENNVKSEYFDLSNIKS
jgi:hypothetical protein